MLKAAVFWLCVLTGLAVIFVSAVLPVYEHNTKMRHRLDVERARLEREQARHARLSGEIDAARRGDPFFYEVMARRHLKLKRPGEEVSAAPVTVDPLPDPEPPAIAASAHYRHALALVSDRAIRNKALLSALLIVVLGIVLGRPGKAGPERPVPAEFED